MRIIITILLAIQVEILVAQNPIFMEPNKNDADSLRRIVQSSQNDTLVMASCRSLALFYLDLNVDSSKYFSQQDLLLARKLNLGIWEADAMDLQAIALSNSSEYSKSLEYFLEALQLCKDQSIENTIWQIESFTLTNNPEFARKSMLATIYLDLGNLYLETGFLEKAEEAWGNALHIATEIKDQTIPTIVYGAYGDLYVNKMELDSAEMSVNKSLALGDSAGYYKYRGTAYLRLSDVALLQGDTIKALNRLFTGLNWAIDQKNLLNEAETYVALAQVYYQLNVIDSSYLYAHRGLSTNRQTQVLSGLLESYNELYRIHKKLGDQDSAFFYLELVKQLGDSLIAKEKLTQFQNIGFEEQLKVKELEIAENELKNQQKVNTLLGGLFTVFLVALLMYRNSRNRRKAKEKIEAAYDQLKSTQQQLVQSEKMASLGELTAGIAHEIQNPLNFVNNFSDINKELIEDLRDAIANNDQEEVSALLGNLLENEDKVLHHGKRAEEIVRSMLQHSRGSEGVKEPTDINALCDEYLRLAFHGLRAKDKSFNADFELDLDESIPSLEVVPQDIGRVLLNLINNAFQAVSSKAKSAGDDYKPKVVVTTRKTDQGVEISVRDNGSGIPEEIKEKIFQPFFTTKPTGQGTGLGLSMSYDIVTKGHGGELKVESEEGKETNFLAILPYKPG